MGQFDTKIDLIKYICRVARIKKKYLENEFFSRSGKSEGILISVREDIQKSQEILIFIVENKILVKYLCFI